MTTKKHLAEQRDRFNQRLTLDIELDNGENINLNQYVKRLVATQSLEGWNGKQEEFKQWIASAVNDYLMRSSIRIWGHSN